MNSFCHVNKLGHIRKIISFFILCCFISLDLSAQEIPKEFLVKRIEKFNFSKEPVVTRLDDNYLIEFESEAYCDATVVIENLDGHIIRHIASGVLGDKAPSPFKKSSLFQSLVWDKKDDTGKYLDHFENLTVRVSLGLKPVFEKTLFWSPQKRIGTNPPVFAASPAGVLIFEGKGVDSMRLYNHDGDYDRTLYPFPRNKLRDVHGLQKEVFPQDGQELPIKHGPKHKSTLFTFGNNKAHDKYGTSAKVIAIREDKVAIIAEGISRMTLAGGSHALGLSGPSCAIETPQKGSDEPYRNVPLSAVFSSDGKYLYTTGYKLQNKKWLPVVMRTAYDSDQPAEVFLGSLDDKDSGSGQNQFQAPLSVAVDTSNRILVADFMNDRIQVFDDNAKFVKSIPVSKPAYIGVHPVSGQVYVCSWMIDNQFIKDDKFKIPAKYIRLHSVEDPKLVFECDLPLNDYNATTSWNRTGGLHYKVCFDFWAKDTRVWLLTGLPYTFGGWGVQIDKENLKGTGIVVLAEQNKKLEIINDFVETVVKNIVRAKPPALIRQRLYVHPKTGDLYIAEADSGVQKSFKQLIRVNPDKVEYTLVDLPFTAEEMAIDMEGYFYLKTEFNVVRYEPETWKEIPFDYGVEKKDVHFDDVKSSSAVSALVLPATSKHGGWWHSGGFSVSPNGDIVASCYNLATKTEFAKSGDENYYSKKGQSSQGQSYIPVLFPGRKTNYEIHIWDKFGKKKYEDVFPGSTVTNGLYLDKDDNLFVLIDENKMVDGKPYFLKWASTLVKVKAGKAKMINTDPNIPVPIVKNAFPNRPQEFVGGWIDNVEWMYGGVGFSGWRSGASCICWNTRPAFDLFSRSFVPEIDHYSVAVLDSNGNLILRMGQYGNVDDGKPLVAGTGPKNPKSIGGDEIALFHAPYLATFSDKRLFISDGGNSRILSVKLDYHQEVKLLLANIGK